MTKLESAAIELHDHLWANMGVSDEWLLHLGGDDEAVERVIGLLNALQDAIRESGYARMEYCPRRGLP
jgi:hypothetical protein